MKIIVFGATGGTGKLVVEQSLKAGHEVTAVVRNPDAIAIRSERLEIIKGDALQPPTFEKSIRGKDAVISCLGVRKREPTTLYSEGSENIIRAMQKGSVNRLICLSAGAVIVPPKGSLLTKWITKNILQRVFRHTYEDMLVMEQALRASDLNWTIIRAPRLRDTRPTGKYRTMKNGHLSDPSKISRADLADYIVKHLTDENTFKGRMEISY